MQVLACFIAYSMSVDGSSGNCVGKWQANIYFLFQCAVKIYSARMYEVCDT